VRVDRYDRPGTMIALHSALWLGLVVPPAVLARDFETVGAVQLEQRVVRVEVERRAGATAGRFAIDTLAPDGSVASTTYVENASTQVLSASQQPAAVWTPERELLVVAARDGLQIWEHRAG